MENGEWKILLPLRSEASKAGAMITLQIKTSTFHFLWEGRG